MKKDESIRIQANSIEEARRQLRKRVPDGQFAVCDEVIPEGRPRALHGVGDTEDSAFGNAEREMPSNANVIQRQVVTQPGAEKVTVEAFDEDAAKKQAETQITDTASIKGINLATRGRRGFLGLGKTPNRYEIDVWQPAAVEITVSTPAVIRARLLVGPEAKSEIREFYKTSYDQAYDRARDNALNSVRVGPGQDPYMVGHMALIQGGDAIMSQAKKDAEKETMAKYSVTKSELTAIVEAT